MAKKKVQDYISEWMDEYGKDNGYELDRCEFVKEANTWYLRVFVDRIIHGQYDYMTSDDCDVVSHYLSKKLDEADPISQNYYLEVSSPGLDRPLTKDKDFERFKGELIDIKLYKAFDGKKEFTGNLEDFKDGIVSIKIDDKILQFERSACSKINLTVVI